MPGKLLETRKRMRIILSRKGFDSKWGGYPSPILPDGRMISLPIPGKSNITYGELSVDKDLTYFSLMRGLKKKIHEKVNDKWKLMELASDATCHLDPDIYRNVRERPRDWLPLFGQCGAAQSHLQNQEIGLGDIFLFFGTFRETEFIDRVITFDRTKPETYYIWLFSDRKHNQ